MKITIYALCTMIVTKLKEKKSVTDDYYGRYAFKLYYLSRGQHSGGRKKSGDGKVKQKLVGKEI